MCESDAYLDKGDEEVLLMESVDAMEPAGEDAWRLVDLFGDQKIVTYRIKRMNLIEHRIRFEA
jgi:predicted RNA-binding protein